MIFKHKGLYIDKSPLHGWGVFINEDIKEGELLEEAPVAKPVNLGTDTNIYLPYLMPYNIQQEGHRWFIPTGYSIHLNHSIKPNIKWHVDYENGIAIFHAARDIKANEELLMNYNYWKIR